MNRRRLLIGGACLLAGRAAIARRRSPALLGWRLPPGARLDYRTDIHHVSGGGVSRRAERWSYVVRDLDARNVATLEGRLHGLGLERPEASSAEASRVAGPVELRLGLDGRVSGCSQPSFSRSLSHRLLGLWLAREPVAPGNTWPDLDLIRRFARLLPSELDLRVEGHATFEGMSDEGIVTLGTAGTVHSEGPGLQLTGWAQWDARRGVLLNRQLTASFKPVALHAPRRLDLRVVAV